MVTFVANWFGVFVFAFVSVVVSGMVCLDMSVSSFQHALLLLVV